MIEMGNKTLVHDFTVLDHQSKKMEADRARRKGLVVNEIVR